MNSKDSETDPYRYRNRITDPDSGGHFITLPHTKGTAYKHNHLWSLTLFSFCTKSVHQQKNFVDIITVVALIYNVGITVINETEPWSSLMFIWYGTDGTGTRLWIVTIKYIFKIIWADNLVSAFGIADFPNVLALENILKIVLLVQKPGEHGESCHREFGRGWRGNYRSISAIID
jgi:hypothetical protein